MISITAGGINNIQYKDICPKCGAIRIDNQYGLERTPEEYIAKMVEVFREVRRVLKKEGTCWIVIGDSYAGSGGAHKEHHANPGISNSFKRNGVPHWGDLEQPENYLPPLGLKPKDLVGIPWRVAFALQADGWWLRQDIIWNKPNPMPESVTDRCTKAHEYVFLMAKSQKYYYDGDAMKEPLAYPNETRRPLGSKGAWELDGRKQRENGGGSSYGGYPSSRNKRSVWTVTTKPFKEAHFATFPPDLIEPMILAGCPEGGIVLDPFIGSGTTARVAVEHRRHYIGIDLNTQYVAMAEERRKTTQRLF